MVALCAAHIRLALEAGCLMATSGSWATQAPRFGALHAKCGAWMQKLTPGGSVSEGPHRENGKYFRLQERKTSSALQSRCGAKMQALIPGGAWSTDHLAHGSAFVRRKKRTIISVPPAKWGGRMLEMTHGGSYLVSELAPRTFELIPADCLKDNSLCWGFVSAQSLACLTTRKARDSPGRKRWGADLAHICPQITPIKTFQHKHQQQLLDTFGSGRASVGTHGSVFGLQRVEGPAWELSSCSSCSSCHDQRDSLQVDRCLQPIHRIDPGGGREIRGENETKKPFDTKQKCHLIDGPPFK